MNLSESLNCSLCISSTTHTYSVATEYIRKWFLSKFPNNTFNHIHIEGKHVFDDFRKFDMTDVLKKSSPVLAIIPRINLDFNRNMLDTNQFGLDMLMRTGDLRRAIIQNYEKNTFIGTSLEQLELRYLFMIKVESKAQQIDLYKYMNMAFSVGHISEDNINMDFHLPYSMMLQLARDSGFTVKDNSVEDVVSFVNYANSISRLPVTFKYRTINGNMEFFMRFPDLDIFIDMTNFINVDDGERRGMLQKNYRLEFEITVRVPTPKFFLYYSSNKHEMISIPSLYQKDPDSIIYPLYSIEIDRIPKINEKGWNQYIHTEYYDENVTENISIEFSPLFTDNLNINRIIQLHNNIGVSPNEFIEFKIYNGSQHLLPHTIDWTNLSMTIDSLVENPISHIAIYIDTEYVHEKLKDLDQLERTRLK